MYSYTVRCKFESPDRLDVAQRWLEWLKSEHIRDVITAGADGAEIFRMDGSVGEVIYEIRYRFANRVAFENYEANHAPRLREEGLSRFPLELGLSYERTTGESVSF